MTKPKAVFGWALTLDGNIDVRDIYPSPHYARTINRNYTRHPELAIKKIRKVKIQVVETRGKKS